MGERAHHQLREIQVLELHRREIDRDRENPRAAPQSAAMTAKLIMRGDSSPARSTSAVNIRLAKPPARCAKASG
jgi:hypothetical protein